ncbi:MAG TPA: hypothetical protein VMX55_10710 [candidate division Zixibacteria bacterium]|nr:hypothetical protein [candidate division Zixibacteria bacterium]
MIENLDLEKLEKETASIIYQDGIFDISLGHVLIAFGIAALLSNLVSEVWDTILGLIIYLVVFIPIWLVYFFVTKPRLGIMEFGIKRKKRNAIVIALVTLILVANIVVFILMIIDVIQFSGQGYLLAVIFGLIPLVIFTSMAYFLSFNRLYLTGFLFSVGFFLKEILTLQDLVLLSNIIFISIGGVIVAIGLVCLIRFFKKYPRIEVENNEYKENGNQQ